MDIQTRFQDAIEDLYETNHYLAAEITKLGYPKLVDGYPPTAGVMWDKQRKKVCFMFNRKFLDRVNHEELKFTIAHEANHVFRGHIFQLRDEVDKRQRMNEDSRKINRFCRKFNLASDCVINDSLTNLYKFPRLDWVGYMETKIYKDTSLIEFATKCHIPPEHFVELNPDLGDIKATLHKGDIIKIPGRPIYGKDLVKVDCQDLTAMDVFYLIPEQEGEGSGDGEGEGGGDNGVENHEGWKSFLNDDGTMDRDFVDAMRDFIEEHMDDSAMSDDEMSQVDDMKEAMENSLDSYASKAGKEALGKARRVGHGDESLNWNKILSALVETRKFHDVWHRPNRKLVEVFPDVILPSTEYTEKQEIFVAIDSSGSIDYSALSLFATVLKNSPATIEIKAISFDCRCYEYDVKGNEPPKGGGGTNFGIIERYIQDNFKKYPKAVFVLTDGCGSSVQPQYPNRWCWILYGYSSEAYCADMKRYNIKDLLK